MADTTKFPTVFTENSQNSLPTQAAVHVPRVKPKLTEEFLLGLEGVADASVWMEDQGLRAHVSVFDEAAWSERSLKAVCLNEIGLHQTPRNVLVLVMGTRPVHAAVHVHANPLHDQTPGLAA